MRGGKNTELHVLLRGLSVEVDGRLGQKGLCCDCVISVKSRAD